MPDGPSCHQISVDNDDTDPRVAIQRLLPDLSDEVSWEVLHLLRSLLSPTMTDAVPLLLLSCWIPSSLLC
jgi:hypothetical protein